MTGAYFFIEYVDGTVQQFEFKTAKNAQKAYNLYCGEPEENAKAWGWDIKEPNRTLRQEMRMKKFKKIA